MIEPGRQRQILESDLLVAYRKNHELQATLRLLGHEFRLVTRQRRRWPARIRWGGWPTPLRLDRPLRPGNGAGWYARWGSDTWYGGIRYVRLGPFIVELGRRPDLDAAREEELAFFRRTYAGAHASAERQLATLRRHLDGPGDHH